MMEVEAVGGWSGLTAPAGGGSILTLGVTCGLPSLSGGLGVPALTAENLNI